MDDLQLPRGKGPQSVTPHRTSPSSSEEVERSLMRREVGGSNPPSGAIHEVGKTCGSVERPAKALRPSGRSGFDSHPYRHQGSVAQSEEHGGSNATDAGSSPAAPATQCRRPRYGELVEIHPMTFGRAQIVTTDGKHSVFDRW